MILEAFSVQIWKCEQAKQSIFFFKPDPQLLQETKQSLFC